MTAWGYGWPPPRMSVGEKKARAVGQAARLRKKGKALDPVTVEGRRLAESWWGAHWNENLERYADFEYRLERGRSYVRNGMVLDLKMEPGLIRAKVAGSRSSPYDVTVKIKALPAATWKSLVAEASGRIESVADLLAGGFPEDLKDLFFAEVGGLFPKPKEIGFDCTCPDWASMCKHVAATLYGVGVRLDSRPALFFSLRGVDIDDIVGEAAQAAASDLLGKATTSTRKGRRRLDTGDAAEGIDAIFGVSVENGTVVDDVPKSAPKRGAPKSGAPKRGAPKTRAAKTPRAKASKSGPRAKKASPRKTGTKAAKGESPPARKSPAGGSSAETPSTPATSRRPTKTRRKTATPRAKSPRTRKGSADAR